MDNKNIPKSSPKSTGGNRPDNTKGSSAYLGLRGNGRQETRDDDHTFHEGESLASLAARFAKNSARDGVHPPSPAEPSAKPDTATILTYVGSAFFIAAFAGGVLYYSLAPEAGQHVSGATFDTTESWSPRGAQDRGAGAAPNPAFEADVVLSAPQIERDRAGVGIAVPDAAPGAELSSRRAPLDLDDLDDGEPTSLRGPAGEIATRPVVEEADRRTATLTAAPSGQAISAEKSNLPNPPAAGGPPSLSNRADEVQSAPKVRISPEKEARMLKRAADFLNQNDIASAQLIYKYLADRGSTAAAEIYKRVQSGEGGKSSPR